MTAAALTDAMPPAETHALLQVPDLRWRLLVIGALAGLGDWLFYGHAIGISLALFLCALTLGVSGFALPILLPRQTAIAATILVTSLIPFATAPGCIAFFFALLGAAGSVTAMRPNGTRLWHEHLADAAALLSRCAWQAAPDLMKLLRWTRSGGRMSTLVAVIVIWTIPLLLGAVFLALFATANPLIERWLSAVDPWILARNVSIERLGLWLLLIVFAWPFLFLRRRARASRAAAVSPSQADALTPSPALRFFGKQSILRALLVFNLLFAMQSLMDAAYLWGGVALPNGMTFAQYAHRGAYPLIVTALLAAAFVIAAMRDGSDAAHSRIIRALVYLWTAQNILLVISSILRLDLYVDVYSLTYWRIAAFIWMVLVAMGLGLIIARIWLRRSNLWLVRANLLSLAATLYIASLLNLPGIIANFNATHPPFNARLAVDIDYLASLGPQAVPGLDRQISELRALAPTFETMAAIDRTRAIRERLAMNHLIKLNDWRAWSYRDWQLQEYLLAMPAVAPASPRPF